MAALGCAVLAALVPTVASAHAIIVSAQPEPGAVLGTPPGAVVLVFDEQLDAGLSQATVTDPSGHAVSAAPVSAFEIRVDLVTAEPGVYHVAWTSVSVVDGHTLTGTYAFAVASAATAAASALTEQSGPLGIAATALRWIEDAALLLALGMVFVEWLGARSPAMPWVRVRVAPVLATAIVAGAALALTNAAAAGGGRLAGMATVITSTTPGQLNVLRLLLEASALTIAVLTGLRSGQPRAAIAALILAALAAVAASGHAAAIDPAWWGIGVDAAHLAAAAVWAGGIAALATLRPPNGWRRDGRGMLVRFTPWALTAFAVTILLGVLEAVSTVGSAGALVTTGYGRTLLVKAGGIAAMVPLSLLAWRRRRPHLRVEAAIVAGVVAAAATLAAFPTPASVARSASLLASLPAAAAGLPRDGQLTLASNAGQVLVGLTLDPGRPGVNDLVLYVLPVEGGAAAAALQVTASLGSSIVPVRRCGDTCRRARVSLRGGETVTVRVAGSSGGVAGFIIPRLPAAHVPALVALARSAMSGLDAVALHETLTGGAGVTIVSDYRERAPNALAYTQNSGAATIVLGSTRYLKPSAGAPWTRESGVPLTREPQYMWTYFTETRSAFEIGRDVVNGAPVDVVAFFAGIPGTPVWLTFSIDAHGRVLRALMTAPGHYMTDTFSGFNAAFDIRAPF
ncbi:MAG TPA: copper resistance protein CopC [Candidatus Dormibacteraeota bacterium]